jgi:hypothetical protein
MMQPEMHPTPESSSVVEIGYDEGNEEVWVRFSKGGLYLYSSVPPVVWAEFLGAPSKGTYVNQVLRPGYPYRRA